MMDNPHGHIAGAFLDEFCAAARIDRSRLQRMMIDSSNGGDPKVYVQVGRASDDPLKVDFGGAGQGGEFVTVNIDAEGKAHASPDIVADISHAAQQLGQHFQPQSIAEAKCIVTLEHLMPHDLPNTLAYWRSFMQPGAKLLIVVPDMRRIAHDWLSGLIDDYTFMGMAYGPPEWQALTAGEAHHWGFSAALLTEYLTNAGYKDVKKSDYPELTHYVNDKPSWNLCLEGVA